MPQEAPQQPPDGLTPAPPQPPQQSQAPTPAHIAGGSHHFPLHKILLVILIIVTVVFTASYIGVYYLLNQQLDKLTQTNKNPTPPISQTFQSPTPTVGFPVQEGITPTCTPRPACLDNEPRCMIPETADMCPKATPTGPSQTACTLEAKLCPDGKTYVSRTGPACEFAACPQ